MHYMLNPRFLALRISIVTNMNASECAISLDLIGKCFHEISNYSVASVLWFDLPYWSEHAFSTLWIFGERPRCHMVN